MAFLSLSFSLFSRYIFGEFSEASGRLREVEHGITRDHRLLFQRGTGQAEAFSCDDMTARRWLSLFLFFLPFLF